MWWAALLNSLLGTLSSGVTATAGSYESIASATGTGSSEFITFTSIPSTYASLQLRIISRCTNTLATSARSIILTFNSDTGTQYTRHLLSGSGSAVSADGYASGSLSGMRIDDISYSQTSATDIMGVAIIDIHDYASTTKNKTVRAFGGVDNNSTNGRITLQSGLWLSTSAINSIRLELNVPNFSTTSTISLYGIKGA